MTRPQARLIPRTKPLLATVSWLLALTLLFVVGCGGEEAPTSESTATPTQAAAPTCSQQRLHRRRPTHATLAPEPTATATAMPSPTATPAPEPTATAAPTRIPAATATPDRPP